MLTERDIAVLFALARYYVLNRIQIQRLVFREDQTGRITRRRLQELVAQKCINRMRLLLQDAMAGSPASVYYPSQRGCEILAEHFDDERFLAGCTQMPQTHHLLHWLAVSDTHIALDAAIAAQSTVRLMGWLNEWDTVNPAESLPEKRYRLYTLLRENPRLVCAPDAAFLIALRGHSKVFYVEQDRNTSGVRRVAASKTPGYHAMAERCLHRRHFPQASIPSFTVLMIAPTPRRRDALRKALREAPSATLWKFATATDITPERLLHDPIFFPCEGDPVPLVKPDAPASDGQSIASPNNEQPTA